MAGQVFCNNCGHGNPLGSNFCSSCGSPIDGGPHDATTMTFAADALDLPDEVGAAIEGLPEGMGALVVTRGKNAGSRFVLHEELTRAGRHPDSHIFLDDVTVSRRHAEFQRSPGGDLVRDAGSLNGTYVNKERVDQVVLHPGDEVQIGSFKLVYVQGEST